MFQGGKALIFLCSILPVKMMLLSANRSEASFAISHRTTGRCWTRSLSSMIIYTHNRILPLERPPDPSSFLPSNTECDDDEATSNYMHKQRYIT